MSRVMPKITKDLGFNFWWDTQKLWKIDLPIQEMKVDELTWMFDLPFWDTDGKHMNLKPIDVKQNPNKYKEQFKKTMQTDLSYPINVIYLKNRWVIMDGLHRLLKANILGNKTIKAKKTYRKHMPFIKQT